MTKIRTINKSFTKTNNLIYEKKTLSNPVSLHFHNFYELEVVTNGEGYTYLNDVKYEIKKGAVILLTPKDFHNYFFNSQTTFINVQFTHEAISNLSLQIDTPISFLTSDKYDKVIKALELIGEVNFLEENEGVFAQKILQGVLSLITSNKNGKNNKTDLPVAVEKAIAYIEAKFKYNPSLEEVANAVYFNKRYFCLLFKKHVGKTYKQYLREVKLNHALNLLKYSKLSVTFVALESGYPSISHFNREFIKFYKTTPSKIRSNSVKV